MDHAMESEANTSSRRSLGATTTTKCKWSLKTIPTSAMTRHEASWIKANIHILLPVECTNDDVGEDDSIQQASRNEGNVRATTRIALGTRLA